MSILRCIFAHDDDCTRILPNRLIGEHPSWFHGPIEWVFLSDIWLWRALLHGGAYRWIIVAHECYVATVLAKVRKAKAKKAYGSLPQVILPELLQVPQSHQF